MKNLKTTMGILIMTLIALTAMSCKNEKKDNKSSEIQSEINHDHTAMKMDDMKSKDGMALDNNSMASNDNEIIAIYLTLKDALVADDSKAAADAGEKLAIALEKMDTSKYNEEQQKELKEIIETAKEHAEHIAKSEMDHQREHFKSLSIDMIDMVAITGTPNTLYQQFCPMYDKGSAWLSASNEIRNPYYGSKMLKCGKVQKEIN